jgi:hypothetical protein
MEEDQRCRNRAQGETEAIRFAHSRLGNVTGYPGVFQSNPCPYPSKPVPVSMCTGFHRYGLRVYRNPRGVMALDMTNEPRKSSASVN